MRATLRDGKRPGDVALAVSGWPSPTSTPRSGPASVAPCLRCGVVNLTLYATDRATRLKKRGQIEQKSPRRFRG
jgi:hypothetical protein